MGTGPGNAGGLRMAPHGLAGQGMWATKACATRGPLGGCFDTKKALSFLSLLFFFFLREIEKTFPQSPAKGYGWVESGWELGTLFIPLSPVLFPVYKPYANTVKRFRKTKHTYLKA